MYMRDPFKFLCPTIEVVESLQIAGDIGSDVFQYVDIDVIGCQLGDECLPDSYVSKFKFNFMFVSAQPNILGQNKEEVV